MPTARLERRLGKVPTDVLGKLKGALAFALDLRSVLQRAVARAAS